MPFQSLNVQPLVTEILGYRLREFINMWKKLPRNEMINLKESNLFFAQHMPRVYFNAGITISD
jgi:hypothetical protein